MVAHVETSKTAVMVVEWEHTKYGHYAYVNGHILTVIESKDGKVYWSVCALSKPFMFGSVAGVDEAKQSAVKALDARLSNPTAVVGGSVKTQMVVIDEHTLGYIQPNSHQAQVLHTSVLRGSSLSQYNPVSLSGRTVRIASNKDFDDYRVSLVGYSEDEYEFLIDPDFVPPPPIPRRPCDICGL